MLTGGFRRSANRQSRSHHGRDQRMLSGYQGAGQERIEVSYSDDEEILSAFHFLATSGFRNEKTYRTCHQTSNHVYLSVISASRSDCCSTGEKS